MAATIGDALFGVISDINNDGFSDVIISNGVAAATTGEPNIIWNESTGAGTFYPQTTISSMVGGNDRVNEFTVADFNGDGRPDVMAVFQDNDELRMYTNINEAVLKIKEEQDDEENSIEKNEGLSIYPNPTTDKLYFEGIEGETFNVTVFDVFGKNVIEKRLNSAESLDVSELHAGVYIVKINDYDLPFKIIKR